MWFIAFILVLTVSVSEYDLFVGISNYIRALNSYCLKFTPDSFYSDIYSALICGNNLSSTSFTQNLKNLGIYHVIVVSGSHLIFFSLVVEKIFYAPKMSKLKFIILPILATYALMTGGEPPVIRALLSIWIDSFQKREKLFWNQNEVIFISVLLCLALFDPWENSYSLVLSFIASVSLSIVSSKSLVKKNALLYILILPFLLPLSAPNPLSFLSNMILSPIIGVGLFPLSFLAYIFPYFYHVVDFLWAIFLSLCNLLGPELQSLDPYPIPLSILWILAFLINLYGIKKSNPKC